MRWGHILAMQLHQVSQRCPRSTAVYALVKERQAVSMLLWHVLHVQDMLV